MARVVVCLALDERDPWKLASARLHDRTWIPGGVRTLHELAAAAAAAGYETEVRGDFHGGVLAEMSEAAGVHVGTPRHPRKPEPEDLLCVPDGIGDPRFFIRAALMVSRPVYLALAPPGLFGWSFVPGWRYVDALDVDPESVGLAEHCRTIGALGFRVWTNASTLGDAFYSAGVPATVIGGGRPMPLPPEPSKDVDVVSVADNRWASVTRAALRGFNGTWRELPSMQNIELIRELGRGRVLVHCARIEGQSRLALEARSMGTCCVGLKSNRFAIGFDDSSGGAVAAGVEEIPTIVERILSDAAGLSARQERARASARAASGWDSFVDRVGNAIAEIEAASDARDAPWRHVASELAYRNATRSNPLTAPRARRGWRGVARGLTRWPPVLRSTSSR